MGRAFEYRRAAKEKRWDKMSKLFPKLGKLITIAAKEGGADPEMNAKLRTAITNAKAQNMPKDNIDAAIKRALGKDGVVITEVNYEAKGPHGVLLFIECATDNPTRTVANVKSYINKIGGQLLQNGSLEFMFSRKAVFEFPKSHLHMDREELELALIDAGLEELDEQGETLYVYGDYTQFGSLSSTLEELKIDVTKASLQRIANTPVEFSEEQLADIEKLIDRIEDDDDVQAVFTNIA
ncbi:MAG: YebC/PmpR family DNA-binding transcriptional regulator [Wolinella succinogenes]|uniref:YebC/PmpR family DNA-binding transcriptional regulator n=1 Tax=Wolinella succinogenes TaxID=844 RepID=UPI0016B649C1|nr:YebC/PmpR family DNA-binding transcriptional regulator [Wolinella succinogenes]NLU34284.1 YebC/PmpR family DNA-binding transcriptional regulator [Wolinella succinogenes]